MDAPARSSISPRSWQLRLAILEGAPNFGARTVTRCHPWPASTESGQRRTSSAIKSTSKRSKSCRSSRLDAYGLDCLVSSRFAPPQRPHDAPLRRHRLAGAGPVSASCEGRRGEIPTSFASSVVSRMKCRRVSGMRGARSRSSAARGLVTALADGSRVGVDETGHPSCSVIADRRQLRSRKLATGDAPRARSTHPPTPFARQRASLESPEPHTVLIGA